MSEWDDTIREIAREQEYQAVDLPLLSVRKYGSYLPVSDELLMDHGVIPDTRVPMPTYPPSRAKVIKDMVKLRVYRVRVWLASKLVGYDIEAHECGEYDHDY